MSDFAVDPAQLETSAGTINESADQADEVAEYAREADPDIWTWGLPGTFLAAPYYFMIAEILHSQLGDVRSTIESYVGKVKECATAYREADESVVTEIETLEGELEGS